MRAGQRCCRAGRRRETQQRVQKTADGLVTLTPLLYPGVAKLRCPINFAALPVPGVVQKAVVTVKNAPLAPFCDGGNAPLTPFADGDNVPLAPFGDGGKHRHHRLLTVTVRR